MTNAEKYLKDEVSVEELITTMENELPLSYVDVAQFWEKPYKLTLTEDERVILRNIDNMCKTIYREKYTGHIRTTLYCPQPDGLCGEKLRCFDHLFQFIKERRRIRNSRTFERRIKMEQIIDLLRETIRRNEDLAKELGATRVECTNWRNKFYERNDEQNMEYKS